MEQDHTPLRVFVAMPGTDMGPSARWKDPEQIKKHFFQKISDRLEEVIGRPVDLVIEKDKVLGGLIHASMFREAWDSDVYIADLTGNNPNVYLELGVRWALKDKVTIIVSQNVSEIKFNAASNRAIPYKDDPESLSNAIDQIVLAITQATLGENCDSPVRLNANIVSFTRKDIDSFEERIKQLEEENKKLVSSQGRDYLTAARSSNDPQYRILMFRKAIELNETLIEGYFDLAVELRKLGNYSDAIIVLEKVTLLDPKNSSLHRELGVNYNKDGRLEDAAKSLSAAVGLDPKDGEAWSNLGGVLRRLGTKDELHYDWKLLHEARDSYNKAVELDDRNTYALGNVARLDLIIAKLEPTRRAVSLDEFETLRLLCAFKLKKQPDDYWLMFDLADSYLFAGELEEGRRLYQKAIQSVPTDYRPSVLSSVLSPLKELVILGVLEAHIDTAVKEVIGEIEQEIA